MQNRLYKKTMSLRLALFLMILIAIAGAVAFYLERDQKVNLLAEKEQAMLDQQNYVLAVYEQIEKNLASIREHETMISQDFAGPENSGDLVPEERIQNEINFIKYLIDDNNKLIASLNDQIDKKDARIAGYEKSIRDYQSKLTKYQEQLDQLLAEKEVLKKDLDNTIQVKNNLARQVDQLGNEVAEMNGIIDAQQQELLNNDVTLHTAYYRVDDYKTLRDMKIVEREGGVLGINRVTTLSERIDANLLNKIDVRDFRKIPIVARHFEIVTGHDPSSYKLEYENNVAEWLNITDPEKFWSKSKYLVIVVRDNNNSELASAR